MLMMRSKIGSHIEGRANSCGVPFGELDAHLEDAIAVSFI